MRVHAREKPHECVQCNEAFVHLYSLPHYETIHTGEKFNECKQFGKAIMLWDPLSSNTFKLQENANNENFFKSQIITV